VYPSAFVPRRAPALGWTWLGMAAKKNESDLERLRILVSDGKGHRLEEVTHTVMSLGHEVVGTRA
jgi:hypothetical protein